MYTNKKEFEILGSIAIVSMRTGQTSKSCILSKVYKLKLVPVYLFKRAGLNYVYRENLLVCKGFISSRFINYDLRH